MPIMHSYQLHVHSHQLSPEHRGLCRPIVPINCTLMPVCSNRLPSFGLIVTDPLTDSPSLYSGTFSLLSLSSLTSTMVRSSSGSSRRMSISRGVENRNDMAAELAKLGEWRAR